ncbi:putative F-box domain-containing protein [Helianthus annuus]|uniref:F-box domain-containing protein n=1 Tax=Helianthus annuus TaxID=4232 RepID=A0A251S8S6_HELAN|nr:putative F-box protein At1g26515 [Helianthus annuus]KAF5764802.1 putative F-box domain-containing protein [Helianthus annuus]KAJ0473316.1 putative F-box domain-containing protein [Helianthus annuus]
MSDHIPFEIQSEIMKKLPVKSLLRFRSISKSCKSLIESSDFITHYSSQQQHLLVSYKDLVNNEQQHLSIVDDDSFPTQRVSVTLPPLVDDIHVNVIKIGSSHGLLCFFAKAQAVIWNPSIRKAVTVVMPPGITYATVQGFGFCRGTTDPKIVKIDNRNWWRDPASPVSTNPWKVEVFTLSTKSWRSPYSSILPRSNSIYIHGNQVDIDGCLYWLGNDSVTGAGTCCHSIVSFDMTSEEFGEVNLPESVTPCVWLTLYKLKESVAVIEEGLKGDQVVYHVWMMEDGVLKSFKKLLTISNHLLDVFIVDVRGFRRTGEPLVELEPYLGAVRGLAAYEPYSKSIRNVGIIGRKSSYYVCSYMETLLLL